MLDRKEYMRQYRKKNRERLNAYQRKYLSDPKHKAKHKEACDSWRKERMTNETRRRIKQYQKEYYEQRKNHAQTNRKTRR